MKKALRKGNYQALNIYFLYNLNGNLGVSRLPSMVVLFLTLTKFLVLLFSCQSYHRLRHLLSWWLWGFVLHHTRWKFDQLQPRQNRHPRSWSLVRSHAHFPRWMHRHRWCHCRYPSFSICFRWMPYGSRLLPQWSRTGPYSQLHGLLFWVCFPPLLLLLDKLTLHSSCYQGFTPNQHTRMLNMFAKYRT